jgi:hypothetical protein
VTYYFRSRWEGLYVVYFTLVVGIY